MKTFARTLIYLVIIYSICFPIGFSLIKARKTIFPKQYRSAVRDAALKYHQDPLFVAALIYSESSFRSQAISKTGAIGLMQLMPSTALQLANKRKLKNFKAQDLFNPSINLDFGCYFLNQLNEEFSNWDHVLIAYNAGPANLVRWQGRGGNPIEESFPETRQYVVKVRWIYRLLKTLDYLYSFF